VRLKIKTIHQYTPSVAFGDSITNALLYTQRLLKDLGYDSKIYISKDCVDFRLREDIYHISEYIEDESNTLFYHFSIGDLNHDKVLQFLDKKILVYHNITPSFYFKDDPKSRTLTTLGRKQLRDSASYFIGCFADSKYNAKELIYYGYKNPQVLTLLVDIQKHDKNNLNIKLIQKNSHLYNIIFVGRVVPNKAQHQLIDTIQALKIQGVKNLKLHIIGGASDEKYMNFLHRYAQGLDILREVNIVGKVSDDDLVSYYALGDLYLSLSNHEGFGMPLVEAMQNDMPVLSFDAGGTSSAVPKECLLDKKSPTYVAKKIIDLQKNPQFRVELVKKQQQKLKEFAYKNIQKKLSNYIKSGFVNL
jgi:glycosyltransferase involved in cell wall biosynthesis